MARYMTDKEREALAEFDNELEDSLKELVNYLLSVHEEILSKFELDICKDWRLDFFLLHLEDCMERIESE